MYKYQIYIYLICCGLARLLVVWAVGSGLWLWPGQGYHMAAEAMPHAALISKNGNKIHTYKCKKIYIQLICCSHPRLAVV